MRARRRRLRIQQACGGTPMTNLRVLVLVSSLSLIGGGAANAQSGGSPTAPTRPSAETTKQLSAQYHAECMGHWDAGTHMTKGEWARTCRRVNDGRLKFRVDNNMGLPPPREAARPS